MKRLRPYVILLRDLLLMPILLAWPRRRRKIVFGAWFGRQFAGGPKYMLKYIVEKGGYECVWIGEAMIRDRVVREVPGVKFAVKGSWYAKWHCLTAGVFIFNVDFDNDFFKFPICQRPMLINTTHGLINKRCGAHNMLRGNGKTLSEYSSSSKVRLFLHHLWIRFDAFVYGEHCWGSTSSVFMRDLFMYNYPGRYTKETFLTEGQPTCDFFITDRDNRNLYDELKKKYAETLGIPADKKWYLYVPGWRHGSGVPYLMVKSPHKADYDRVLDEQNAIIIDKEHPLTLAKAKIEGGLYGNIYMVSPEKAVDVDIQELMFVCDRMISDFSSIYYDYALLNRPVIEFTYDYDEVATKVFGLDFDLREYAPGPFAYSEDEFIALLRKTDVELLAARTEKFFTHIDCEKGHAREAIFKLIQEHA